VCDYTSIQAAVDAASSGSTIVIFEGTYNESVTVIDAQLMLQAVGTVYINGNITLPAGYEPSNIVGDVLLTITHSVTVGDKSLITQFNGTTLRDVVTGLTTGYWSVDTNTVQQVVNTASSAGGGTQTQETVLVDRVKQDNMNTVGVRVLPRIGVQPVPSGVSWSPEAPIEEIDTPYDATLVALICDDGKGNFFDAQSGLGGLSPFDYLRLAGVPCAHAVMPGNAATSASHSSGGFMSIDELKKVFWAGGGELLVHSHNDHANRPTTIQAAEKQVIMGRDALAHLSSSLGTGMSQLGDSWTYQPGTYAPWYDVGAPVLGWVNPGDWGPLTYSNEDDWLSRLIRQNYAYSFVYEYWTHFVGPCGKRHMQQRMKLHQFNGDSWIDPDCSNIIAPGARYVLYFHAHDTTDWSKLKIAFDRLIAARDAGKVFLVNPRVAILGRSRATRTEREPWWMVHGGDFNAMSLGDLPTYVSETPHHGWSGATPGEIVNGDLGKCLSLTAGEYATIRLELRPGTYIMRFAAKTLDTVNKDDILRIVTDYAWIDSTNVHKYRFNRTGKVITRTAALTADPYDTTNANARYYKAFGVPRWAQFVELGFAAHSSNSHAIEIDQVEIAPT
jgi:hypothetical protein